MKLKTKTKPADSDWVFAFDAKDKKKTQQYMHAIEKEL